MKNLKKIMSSLLVTAIMTTTLVPAFASSYTYERQANALYDMGLLLGVSTDPAVFDPDLGADLDRETAITMMVRLVGKIDVANAMTLAEAKEALKNYTDASKLSDWAVKPVAYAIKNNLVIGSSETTLEPQANFEGKMFSTIILRNVGYSITNDNYDKATTMMVENGGLTADEGKKFDSKLLIRDDMTGMSYGSLKLKYNTTKATIIETLVTTGKVEKAKAVKYGLVSEAPAVAGVAQTGSKTFSVNFTAPVADASKVVVSVKKGSISLNTAKVTPAADKMSVAVEMATPFGTGDYTVSVAGVAAEAVTNTLKAEAEKVAKIEFTSEKAVLDRNSAKIVTTGYKVSNQFSEDVTKNTPVTFTTGKGTATGSNGTLTITLPADQNVTYTKDEKLSVSALHVTTGTFASAALTVSDKATVADIAITGMYNADNKTLDINADYTAFWLTVDAKDQYGKKVPATDVISDVVVSVSNKSIADVAATFANEKINGVDTTVLKLVAPASKIAGTAKVTIISTSTGKLTSFDVVVKDGAKLDVINFTTPDFAAAKEELVVPFTSVDQFGNEIKNANGILTGITPSFSDSNVTGSFSQDYVTGKPKFTINAKNLTEAKTVVMTLVTPTGKLAQMTINFQAPAEAKVISGLKDVSNKILVGDTSSIEAKNVVIKDQYGRDMKFDATANKIVLESSDETKVDVVGDVYAIAATDGKISLNAAKKGSATITLKLQTVAGKDVDGSSYPTTFSVVEKADIVSYEVADVEKVYSGASTPADYAKALKVYGILADGSKVVVPHTDANFKVTYTATGLSFASGKFSADATFAYATDKSSKEVPVVVTVIGATGSQVFTKTVTVTKEAPAAQTLTLKTNGNGTVEADGIVSALVEDANTQVALEALVNDVLVVTDQYGVKMTSPAIAAVIATNLPTGKVFGGTDKAALAQGDSYSVTVITDNAKVITLSVKLK